MLVLSRKKNESILIGDQIELVVIDVDGDQVKIGIKAPKSIDVYRKEVYESILLSNREASGVKLDLQQMNQLLKKKQ